MQQRLVDLATRRLAAEQKAVVQMQAALQAKDMALAREWETKLTPIR